MKQANAYIAFFLVAAVGIGSAQANETCYDFGRQSSGQTWRVGDTLQLEHMKVHIHGYKRDGLMAAPPSGDQYVDVRSTRLSGGAPPEIRTYLATMLIEPRQPMAQISFRVAENRLSRENPFAGGHANIVINGQHHEVVGGLAQLHGRTFGGTDGAQVSIDVKLRRHEPGSDGPWWEGEMKVRAVAGQIRSFGIGGIPLLVDDVCFTPNAP